MRQQQWPIIAGLRHCDRPAQRPIQLGLSQPAQDPRAPSWRPPGFLSSTLALKLALVHFAAEDRSSSACRACRVYTSKLDCAAPREAKRARHHLLAAVSLRSSTARSAKPDLNALACVITSVANPSPRPSDLQALWTRPRRDRPADRRPTTTIPHTPGRTAHLLHETAPSATRGLGLEDGKKGTKKKRSQRGKS